MALSKQDRDQFVALQVAHTTAVLQLLDRLSPADVSSDPPAQGAPPQGVIDFTNAIIGAHTAPVRSPAEQAAYEAAANAAAGPGKGSIAASSLTAADAVYMLEAQDTAMRQLGDAGKWRNQDVYKVLLSGSDAEIRKVRDVRSRADAQAVVSAYNADKGAWVAKYAPGSKLEKAFHTWLRAELKK